MKRFKREFAEEFNFVLKTVGGNIAELVDVALPALPNFDDKFSGLDITIHGTQRAKVYIAKFGFNAALGNYYAEFRAEIFDDFGLSVADVVNIQDKFFNIPKQNELKAWWILQNQRGYRPFETRFTFNFSVKGTIK